MKTRLFIIILGLVLVFSGITAADTGSPDFSLTFRGQYSGDQFNQLAIFPAYKWTDHLATTATFMITNNVGESSLGVKVMGHDLWAAAYGGLLYDTLLGRQIAWYNYLNCGYSGKWVEIGSHNFFTTSVRHHAEMPNSAFNRLWVQFGSDQMHLKVGAQMEAISPQDAKGEWQRSTTYVGPRVSFPAGPIRADIFYGLAVQDATADIDNDTKPLTRAWVAWTF